MTTAKERGGVRRIVPPRKRKMDPTVFQLALDRVIPTSSGRQSYEAARLVMCEGKSIAEAVRLCRVSRQAIYQAMDRVEGTFKQIGICHACGHRLT